MRTTRKLALAGAATALLALQGCAVFAVADAALTTGAVVVKTTAKGAGLVVDVATYSFSEDDDDDAK